MLKEIRYLKKTLKTQKSRMPLCTTRETARQQILDVDRELTTSFLSDKAIARALNIKIYGKRGKYCTLKHFKSFFSEQIFGMQFQNTISKSIELFDICVINVFKFLN